MKTLIATAVSVLFVAGCAGMQSAPPSASVKLMPTKGNSVSGSVTFTAQGDKMRVVAAVSGLTPGLHGFHVHEKGDCSAPDGTSAGGHFNPFGKAHGDKHGAERHAGDLGNLSADASGNARFELEVEGLSLKDGAANNIAGRSVIVHAQADDLKSQPAGNSGPRQACGLIARN